MNKLPIAKTENLVIQNFENEIVIYDLTTNKAFCLNETSSIVYQACDGKTDFDELRNESGFTDELIHLTLAELEKQKFIEFETDYVSPFAGMTRREAVRKVGLATMMALPVIASLVAPSATMAQSGGLPLLAACTINSECASMVCNSIALGPSGTLCCRFAISNAAPGATFCTDSPGTCDFRCCSGMGTAVNPDPGCMGTNFIRCTCNPV